MHSLRLYAVLYIFLPAFLAAFRQDSVILWIRKRSLLCVILMRIWMRSSAFLSGYILHFVIIPFCLSFCFPPCILLNSPFCILFCILQHVFLHFRFTFFISLGIFVHVTVFFITAFFFMKNIFMPRSQMLFRNWLKKKSVFWPNCIFYCILFCK